MVSAHWITPSGQFSVTSAEKHSLLFDYGGFPEESYKYSYDAPGSPVLASKICSLLRDDDLDCKMDSNRGWDHGVFVPLMIMFPEADIPVVSLSIDSSMNPELHIKAGKAIASLRSQNILIIGSGSTFHNFSYFFTKDVRKRDEGLRYAAEWNEWLVKTLATEEVSVLG